MMQSEILRGDTLPKVDVAAPMVLPAINMLQWRLLNGDGDLDTVVGFGVVLAVTTQPSCCPSQLL